jgi:hypothetical protein
VIFEIVPPRDHAFDLVWKSTIEAIQILKKERNMHWSFLIDTKFYNEGTTINEIYELFYLIKKNGLTDGLEKGTTEKPLIFIFSPSSIEAKEIIKKYGKEFDLRFPIWYPDSLWDSPVKSQVLFSSDRQDSLYLKEEKNKITTYKYLESKDYIPFWTDTAFLKGHNIYNGFVSVIPGYDDLPQKRNPQLAPKVSRFLGRTYLQQFKYAIKKNPRYVVVYGWNEYLESTEIEPTKEYGEFYLKLTELMIDKARGLENSAMP